VKKNPQINKIIINAVCLAGAPVLCFFALEFLADADITGISFLKIILNLIILALFEFLYFGISGSTRKSVMIEICCAAVYGMLNYYLIQFRGIPILAPDITVIGTAANVAGHYSFMPDMRAAVFIIIMAALLVIVKKTMPDWNLCRRPKYHDRIKTSYSKTKRMVMMAASIAAIGGFLVLSAATGMLSAADVTTDVFRPVKNANCNGTMLNLLSSFTTMFPQKTSDYSTEAVKAIIRKPVREKSSSQTRQGKKPNMIVIMDESFCDLSSLGDLNSALKNDKTTADRAGDDILPYYHSLKKNTIKGDLFVSTFAGGTAQTEFEFLTGCSMMAMPVWTTPYQLYLKDETPSFTRVLKAQDYTGNKAFHPFKGSGYNRDEAYKSLGFSDFLTQNDIDIREQDKAGNYESDSADFKEVIKEYKKSRSGSDSNKPFYIFNVTMQNHSPYGNEPVSTYLDLLKKSDDALKELTGYFSRVDEPTEIVFFGDHAPELPDEFYEKLTGGNENDLSAVRLMQKYKASYMIWTNYDISRYADDSASADPAANGIKAGSTSANYLAGKAMKTAGLKLTGFETYLTGLEKHYPIVTAFGYYDRNGSFHARENDCRAKGKGWPGALPEKLKQYWSLEYNDIFDKKNRQENFFLK